MVRAAEVARYTGSVMLVGSLVVAVIVVAIVSVRSIRALRTFVRSLWPH